jgi:fluoroacetyl-CoA thioesterase
MDSGLALRAPRNDEDIVTSSAQTLVGLFLMDARDIIKVGMSAERTLVVPLERTVGHFVPHMPKVYATPMMILEMELASGDAIAAQVEPGWVTVGTEVDIRHLAATPAGALVRTIARVIAVERRVIRFEVEAFDNSRRIGAGRHARALVNLENFKKRLGMG